MTRPSKWRGVGSAIVAAVVAAALLAGCGGVVGSLLGTDRSLQRAGFGSVSVVPQADNDVSASVHVDARASAADAVEVGAVVWRHLHERFSRLRITVHGTGGSMRASVTFDQLQSELGPRNPAWNRTDVQSSLEHVGVAVGLGLLVVVVLVVVVVVLAVRRRRRGRPGPPSGPGPRWGSPSWPAAPPGPSWGPAGTGPPGGAPPGWGPPAAG